MPRLAASGLIALAAVLFSPASPMAAVPPDDELVLAARSTGAVTMLGPLRPHRGAGSLEAAEKHVSYRAAISAFGRPRRIARPDRIYCTARWPSIGLTIAFGELGGRTACRDGGWVNSATVRSARWTTREGLAVGDRTGKLKRLYPHAQRHGQEWWLARAYSRIGTGGWYGTLVAVARNGEVRAFRAVVGASGD